MQITSTYFQQGEPIPARFSCDGENINPALTFSEIPDKTESLVLIIEDPDAPNGLFTHWILYNMSPGTLQIVDGEVPLSGQQGLNDRGETCYTGPKPPSGSHRYYFKLFALDTMIENGNKVDREALYNAMDGHIVEQAEIMGTFSAD